MSSNSTPNVKRQKTLTHSNSNQNATPGSSTSKRTSITKDKNLKTSDSNIAKPQRQQTMPSISTASSTSGQTIVRKQPSASSSSQQKCDTSLPVPASFLKQRPPDEVYKDSLPLSFLLTKVRGIEPQFNNRLAMHIKGNYKLPYFL